MQCKSLFPWSMISILVLECGFSACSKSSKKSGPGPVAPIQPGTPTPTPTSTPTANVKPAMVGDWQSQLMDSNYAGNITYTLDQEGRLQVSLLIYSRGQKKILAERHEWKGAFSTASGQNPKFTGELVRSTCAQKSKTVSLSVSQTSQTEYLWLLDAATGPYFQLSRVKGGLIDNVHQVAAIQGYTVVEGCFANGRLDQFVPTPANQG